MLPRGTVAVGPPRFDVPPPGGVAWLEVSAEDSNGARGRTRTGPLGLQILPLAQSRAPYFFKGARLRGTRCVWSASTVSGAELTRPPRAGVLPQLEGALHLLARVDAGGSVFDPATSAPGRGMLRLLDPAEPVSEHFGANAHVFTLNIPQAAVGLDAGAVADLLGQSFELTGLQETLLRSAVPVLTMGGELARPASLVGVDRYLCGLAGLVMRTIASRPPAEPEQLESVRARSDSIIFEQAADPTLTPAAIAAQLNISLRQLYRAFNRTESPAARIRRRRLEHAAELLSARSPQPQVERVAQECGFASAEYFSRAFRREFGISPRAYRSAHRDTAAR